MEGMQFSPYSHSYKLDSGEQIERFVSFHCGDQELLDRFFQGKEISFSYQVDGGQRNLTISIGKNTPLFKNAMQNEKHLTPEGVKGLLLKHIANLIPVDESAKQPMARIRATFEEDRCAQVSIGDKDISDSRAVGKRRLKARNLTTELSYLPGKAKMRSIFKENASCIELKAKKRFSTSRNIEKLEAMLGGEGFEEHISEHFTQLKVSWNKVKRECKMFNEELESLRYSKETRQTEGVQPNIDKKIQEVSRSVNILQEEMNKMGDQIEHLSRVVAHRVEEETYRKEDFERRIDALREESVHILQKNEALFREMQVMEQELSSMQIPCGDEEVNYVGQLNRENEHFFSNYQEFSHLLRSQIKQIQRNPREYLIVKENLLDILQKNQENSIFQAFSQGEFECFLRRIDFAQSPMDLIRSLREEILMHTESTFHRIEGGRKEVEKAYERRIEKFRNVQWGGLSEYVEFLLENVAEMNKYLEKMDSNQLFAGKKEELERREPLIARQKEEEFQEYMNAALHFLESFSQIIQVFQDPQKSLEDKNNLANQLKTSSEKAKELIERMESILDEIGSYDEMFQMEILERRERNEMIFQRNEEIFERDQQEVFQLNERFHQLERETSLKPEHRSYFQQAVQESMILQKKRYSELEEFTRFRGKCFQCLEKFQSREINLGQLKELLCQNFKDLSSAIDKDGAHKINQYLLTIESLRKFLYTLDDYVERFEREALEENQRSLVEMRQMSMHMEEIIRRDCIERENLNQRLAEWEQNFQEVSYQMEKLNQENNQMDEKFEVMINHVTNRENIQEEINYYTQLQKEELEYLKGNLHDPFSKFMGTFRSEFQNLKSLAECKTFILKWFENSPFNRDILENLNEYVNSYSDLEQWFLQAKEIEEKGLQRLLDFLKRKQEILLSMQSKMDMQ